MFGGRKSWCLNLKRVSEELKKEERQLLALLRKAFGEEKENESLFLKEDSDWERLLALAKEHAVLSFLYDVCKHEETVPKWVLEKMQQAAYITAVSNYRLLFLTKHIYELLEENEIQTIVLKGISTASLYPVPEMRKSGDVDMLLCDGSQLEEACQILEREGYVRNQIQEANHHMELKNKEGISIELHSCLTEAFESRRMNQYMEHLLWEFTQQRQENVSWGFSFCELQPAYHAFYLILHMLQHYLRAGFGLKLLCDWVVFWEKEARLSQKQKQIFQRLIRGSKTEGFVCLMSAVCMDKLGLCRDRVSFFMDAASIEIEKELVDLFTLEIFAAGEFGHRDTARMVAMTKTGLQAYIREFHHQMQLNYPESGKIWLLWPFLWLLTFVRFVHNNKKRQISGREILQAAAKRSTITAKMNLFDFKDR